MMPIAKGTGKSDAQRRAENKYQAAHYKTLGCKLPKATAEQFIEKVKANDKTVNAVLSEMIQSYIDN